MLATLVIGLREGLEASLIVGIIAAFLRKNGKSLSPMWLGVGLAVALSIAVGIGLAAVEQALPQALQEGMETVIGAVAIFFVTGMIAWMNAHARDMKRQLEFEAADALGLASAYALASMAFLAVLKEGFETSVFLLATFSAAQSALLAGAGAVLGLALAVAIGWGIYAGGVRINLSRFFRITGVFLILVAAGLVITALRTAHEAGWLNAGQQATVDLSWLVARGTIQSALITGVLGIPADPRLVEVLGWFAYLIPVVLFVYWQPAWRRSRAAAVRVQLGIAGGLAVVAVGLAVLYPRPDVQVPTAAPMVAAAAPAGASIGTVTLRKAAGNAPATFQIALAGADAVVLPLPPDQVRQEPHEGMEALLWEESATDTPAKAPATLTLDQVIAIAGGRLPVGVNATRNPGPFAAAWAVQRTTDVWIADRALLDATGESTTVLTLSGGGLQTPRTLTVAADGADATTPPAWQVSDAYRGQVVAALAGLAAARTERAFWAEEVPGVLALVALVLAGLAWRRLTPFRPAGATGMPSPLPTTDANAKRSA